jgi:two-component system probable response regulator PhcQ
MADTTPATTAPAAKRKYGVIYIDDEETALKYFKRGLDKDCPVFTANSGAAALEILEKEHAQIGVVLSDQKMPAMTGAELLTVVRQKWPNMIRMLITAYSEVESAIQAVNEGAISKYITKPAEPPKLKQVILAALDEFDKRNDRDEVLTQKLDGIQRMMVADRIRSLAAMADGISHHLRNSMTAMSCFLEESNPSGKDAAKPATGDPYIDQLWTLARSERGELLNLLQSVAQASSNRPDLKWAGGLAISSILTTATIGIPNVTATLADGVPAIKADGEKLAYVFKTLCKYAARLSGARDGAVRIFAEPLANFWNTSGVRLKLVSAGNPWAERDVAALFTPFAFPSSDPSDLGIEMLMAFFIAHQHGGDVIVHREAPAGPGFEVLLPVDPAAVQRPQIEEHLLGKSATLSPAA